MLVLRPSSSSSSSSSVVITYEYSTYKGPSHQCRLWGANGPRKGMTSNSFLSPMMILRLIRAESATQEDSIVKKNKKQVRQIVSLQYSMYFEVSSTRRSQISH